MRRKIVIHGSKSVVQDVARALGVRDMRLWIVKKNGKKVLQTADVTVAIGYVADETGMAQQTVRAEALNGKQLIDDAQVAWTIRQEMAADVIGASRDADNFTPAMIEQLRKDYGNLQTIDPGGEAYQKLTGLLDRLTQPQLQTLAQAGIKFVSNLARNRVKRPANDGRNYFSPSEWEKVVKAKYPSAQWSGSDFKKAIQVKVDSKVVAEWFPGDSKQYANGTVDATQMPQKKRDFAYKGYLIRYSALGEIFIEKDGHGISAVGSAKTEEEAKKIIDKLV